MHILKKPFVLFCFYLSFVSHNASLFKTDQNCLKFTWNWLLTGHFSENTTEYLFLANFSENPVLWTADEEVILFDYRSGLF